MKVKSLSRVRLFAIPWTVVHQASLPMGFSRQEYWSGLPLIKATELMYFPQALVECSLRARHCAKCIGNVTVIMRSPQSSRSVCRCGHSMRSICSLIQQIHMNMEIRR